MSAAQDPPLLSVVRGNPSPEEVAALVSVVAGIGARPERVRRDLRSEWSAHYRKVRGAHRHGPGSWRFGGR